MNAIILSGGRGTRLGGREKAFLKIGKQAFIEREIDILKKHFNRIIVVTNKPDLYLRLLRPFGARNDVVLITDEEEGCGPLMGLYTGLKASKARYNFVTTSDAPLLQHDLIRYLKKNADGCDGFVPRWDKKIQPLCAVYSRRCVKFIEKAKQFPLPGGERVRVRGEAKIGIVSPNLLRVTAFYKHAKIKFVPEKTLRKFDPKGASFFNVNTTSDYNCLFDISMPDGF